MKEIKVDDFRIITHDQFSKAAATCIQRFIDSRPKDREPKLADAMQDIIVKILITYAADLCGELWGDEDGDN